MRTVRATYAARSNRRLPIATLTNRMIVRGATATTTGASDRRDAVRLLRVGRTGSGAADTSAVQGATMIIEAAPTTRPRLCMPSGANTMRDTVLQMLNAGIGDFADALRKAIRVLPAAVRRSRRRRDAYRMWNIGNGRLESRSSL